MEAVIFDCDGVLVDSEILAVRVGLRAVKELGLSYSEDEYIHRFLGTTMNAYFKNVEEDHREAHGTSIPDGFFETLLSDSRDEMDAALVAIEGTHAAVESIAVPLAVASSSGVERLNFKLNKTGLFEAFAPHIYSGELVQHGKPAPDLYLHAADKLDVAAKACVAIEDSVHGVISAKAAGMTVVGFIGGGHCRAGHDAYLSDAGADIVVGHMKDLSTTLARFS
jgi:beta-phosphoglucomutase-like phosphatase (HAD superfamily)